MSQCVTCGAAAATPYCPQCGEKRFDHHDLSLKHFFEHAFEAFTHFDSAIFRTVRALALAPGRLTADWSAGRRKIWLAPVQLFLVMNVLYFVSHAISGWNTLTTPLWVHMNETSHREFAAQMVNGKLARTGMKLEAYQQRFDAKAEIQAKSLVILMAPVLALAVALVHADQRRYFAEHLVFSLHFYAFFLLYLSLTQPLLAGIVLHFGLEREWKTTDLVVSTLAIGAWGIYLATAARTVYRQAWWVAIVKAGVLSFAVLQILYLYRFILFFITFKST